MGTTTTYSEHLLISLLKERDNKAFSYLYDHYAGALYSIILQILKDDELSQDVLQEVFINIWRKIESYDAAKGRLFTWMLNIARNASIDMLRSKAYQHAQQNHRMDENVNIRRDVPVVQMNIDNIGLNKVLGKLKKDYRVLLDLAYFKGYTHEEIAQIENIPLGTVKTRSRNALMQLREVLK